jgi:hypothetical protein
MLLKKRQPTRSAEPNDAETAFVQQLGQRPVRPELNVPAIPEWTEMRVPPVGECKNKVPQVAVIRSSDDQMASRPEQLLRESRQIERFNQMLDDLGCDRHVKAFVANHRWIVIHA